MTLFLLHKRFNGEPIGIWDEEYESEYVTNDNHEHDIGKAAIGSRSARIPWEEFVSQQASRANHLWWWTPVDTLTSMSDALSVARAQYFAGQAAKVVPDK